MKKTLTRKPLQLHTELVRVLTDTQLTAIAGGLVKTKFFTEVCPGGVNTKGNE